MDSMEVSSSSSQEKFQFQRVSELSECIDLLLAVPYAASLHKLRQSFERTRLIDIRLWIEHNTHKVQPLTELVVAGLEYDVHATTLVELLAPHTLFRDSILALRPSILSGVLKAALVNERSFESYSPMAVALLSPPLSEDHLIPVTLGSLLSTIHQAISEDNTRHLYSLECILRSNSSHALPMLSQTQLYNLTATLASLLGSNETSTVLGALSCLSSIASNTGDKSDKSSKNSKSLFVEEKGKKVIRLVLSTISSQMSSENQFCDSTDLMRNVEFIINILNALDRQTLHEWLQSREGISSTKKFFDKMGIQTDSALVSIACKYIPLIFPTAALNSDLKKLSTLFCTNALERIKNDSSSLQSVEIFELLLPYANPPELGLETLLEQIFEHQFGFVKDRIDWLSRARNHVMTRIVQSLRNDVGSRQYLGSLFSTERYARLITRYTDMSIRRKNERNSQDQTLHRCFCRLIICTQAEANMPEHAVYDYALTSALLDTLMDSLGERQIMDHRTSRLKDVETFRFHEAVSTPHSGSSSRGWKSQLLKDLHNEAEYQHTSMVARVDNICRDLERRAEINEEPLREVERALNQAQDLVRQLQAQLEEANSELQQRDAENQHVFEERARYEGVIANLIREVEVSNARVIQGEQLDLKHKETVTEIQNHSKRLEADLWECQGALREQRQLNDEHIMDLTTTLQTETDQKIRLTAQLEDSVAQLRLEQAKVADHIVTHHQDQADHAATAASLDILEQELQKEKTKMQALSDDLAVRSKEFDLKMHQYQAHNDRLEADLNAQNKVVTDLRSHLEDTKSLADEQLGLLAEDHRSSLRTLEDELQLTKSRGDSVNQSLSDENSSLKESLRKIRASYDRRCAEFEKAQDLSRRLMAVMGGVGDDPSPANALAPLPRMDQLSAHSAQSIPSTKRSKATETMPIKNSRRALSCDMTTDSTFDSPNKENQSPMETTRDGRRVRKEDSMILSELSGLGL